MTDILKKIEATKRDEIELAKERIRPSEMEARAQDAPPSRGFADAIRRKHAEGRPSSPRSRRRAPPRG